MEEIAYIHLYVCNLQTQVQPLLPKNIWCPSKYMVMNSFWCRQCSVFSIHMLEEEQEGCPHDYRTMPFPELCHEWIATTVVLVVITQALYRMPHTIWYNQTCKTCWFHNIIQYIYLNQSSRKCHMVWFHPPQGHVFHPSVLVG